MSPEWEFWIDRGGTFTDVLARSPSGRLHVRKLLSESPEHYADAALEGVKVILESEGRPDDGVAALRLGTTVGTNTLLQRNGEPVVLIVTRGFRDLLKIGYQNRPDLFALEIVRPEPLPDLVIEADERLRWDGTVAAPIDADLLDRDLREARDAGYRSVAITLLHGYRNPVHELTAARIAGGCGFQTIVCSHAVSPLPRIVTRAETTAVDAYLTPTLYRYLSALRSSLDTSRIFVMQSSGGLALIDSFRGKDSLYSGPAGGVVGMVRTAAEAGFERLVGFDMGGTSTDVTLVDGAIARRDETLLEGVRVRTPAVDVHSVAAGGGSVVRFDGERLRVGPESAGADPGPACYRRGGPLAVTDCNVLLGRIRPEFFPAVFGAGSDLPIDERVVREGFAGVAADVSGAYGKDWTAEEVAAGFLRVAVEKMANAIREISTRRGFDVSEFVLCCFGGASGQHACAVAAELGIEKVLIHPLCGLLSAYGIGLADLRAIEERPVESELSAATLRNLEPIIIDLKRTAASELVQQGVASADIEVVTKLKVRYHGSDTSLEVFPALAEEVRKEFEALHRQYYGYDVPDRRVIVTSVSVEASGGGREPAEAPDRGLAEYAGRGSAGNTGRNPSNGKGRPSEVPFWQDGHWVQVPLYARDDLEAGVRIAGPAIVAEDYATTVVDEGWVAEVTSRFDLVLTPLESCASATSATTSADPVLLEVFNNLFRHIAEQMGHILQKSARSVNVKERLDFSCAVFDPQGDLVANAPHIPVHFGSMSDTVKRVIELHGGEMAAGDSFLINDPYHGGTHLPDLTIVTPVVDATGGCEFFVASRAHHADVGGIAPGSMPALSTRIEEEGVVFRGQHIVAGGRFLQQEVLDLLRDGPYPARSPEDNLADLKAQLAASQQGVRHLKKAVGRYGLKTVRAYMGHVKANAAAAVRKVLANLNGGSFTLEMDTGQVICVNVIVDKSQGTVEIDFTGTSARRPNNFNAPTAITTAAVLYVLRTLIADDIPLNSGCLEPVRIRIPDGCFLKPQYPDAVAAGNVETSQCIADALLAAFGKLASSQGTMNNFSFGNDRYQYYETLCGGAGAGPGVVGADAVHTHMTNSRLTDPEIIEMRYPVIVEDFSIRAGSGGSGEFAGGDGVVRRIRVHEPMTASVLSNRRRVAPFGLAGGRSGRAGRNAVQRVDGTVEELPGCAAVELEAGDVFVIETPGGGGYGRQR